MEYIHMVEYYLTIKRRDVMMQATTWINLECPLSERSMPVKILYCVIPFIKLEKWSNM